MTEPHTVTIEDALAILQHVPFVRGKPLEITELGGGMTNKIFKVVDGNDAYVLRVFGRGTALLGIDRDREYACSKAIADAGLGAEVMAYLPKLDPKPYPEFGGALLVRFLKGKLLKPADVQDPVMLGRIGAALKKCHAIPIASNMAEISVFRVTSDYFDKALERNVELPGEWEVALNTLSQIEKESHARESPCLCHNDLLADNFVDDDGQVLRIIDWEYGGKGNRYFDLGNFSANMQLTDEQESRLLKAYFGEIRTDDLRRVKLMRLASDLREASWSYLQSALSNLHTPQHFLVRGRKHFDRFLKSTK